MNSNKFLKEIDKLYNLKNWELNLFEFNFVDKDEISAYLKFSNNFNNLDGIFSNIQLNQENIKKNVLLYLLIRNLVNSNNDHNFSLINNKIKTLKLIKELNFNYQENILKTYVLSGIYFIKENIDHPFINFKKSLLKYFHDSGGFDIDVWGVNIKINILIELIDRNDLEIILNKNKNIDWQQFYMLTYY
ncbi:MAG: hypothetical protein KatS3mg094_303 [Candidatus Parcubacteria bacterium]|nr:MAG: hypothetical protein KatS3mg094_303 [Candidatus Parcubacteria bacterium]